MCKRCELFLGAILVVIVLVSCAACATTSPPATGNTSSAPPAKQCPPAPAHCDLQWGGGPVQHQPTAYAIFWGQQWEDQPYYAAANTVLSYLQQVGGTSYANILSQYADAQGSISNQLKAGDFWVDDRTTNLLSVTSNTCHGKTLTDSALKDEINYAIVAKGWPVNDPDSTYLVYTPPGYAVDTEGAPDDAVSPCSNTAAPKGYCGYHNSNTSLNSFRVYAAIVYPTGRCSVKGQHVPVLAPDDAGQTLVDVTAHEQFEAATDPDPHPGTIGWQDVTGDIGEISDKCAWKFPSGGLTQLGSGSFAVQLQWSNATHSCVNSYAGSPPPPTSSYPSLAAAYQGTGYNSTFSASGSLVLTDIEQDQQVITGKVFWGNGLVGDGTLIGSIDAKGNITLTDTFPTIPECCSALTFTGSLASDGSLSGTYTGTPTPGQPTQHGTWQVKPYQPAANPHLGATYDGMVTNLTVNVTTTLALTNIVQNQQAFSGNMAVGPGLNGTGPITGTIAADGSVTFTLSDLAFSGFLFPDGALSGTYIVTDAAQDGTWQTTPR